MNRQDINELITRANKTYFKKYFVPIEAPIGWFQMDLMDMRNVKRKRGNQLMGFGLVIVEVFSRRGWLYPLRNKKPATVAAELPRWWNDVRGRANHIQVQTDAGSEFKNEVDVFFQRRRIEHRTVQPGDKNSQAIVERWIKTLRERFRFIWLTNNNLVWVPYINQVVDDYNDTVHRSMKATPMDVWNGAVPMRPIKPYIVALRTGDRVRVYIKPNTFTKRSSVQMWTRTVYTVAGKDGHKFILVGIPNYRFARWALKKTNKPASIDPTETPELIEEYRQEIADIGREQKLAAEGIDQNNIIETKRRKPTEREIKEVEKEVKKVERKEKTFNVEDKDITIMDKILGLRRTKRGIRYKVLWEDGDITYEPARNLSDEAIREFRAKKSKK